MDVPNYEAIDQTRFLLLGYVITWLWFSCLFCVDGFLWDCEHRFLNQIFVLHSASTNFLLLLLLLILLLLLLFLYLLLLILLMFLLLLCPNSPFWALASLVLRLQISLSSAFQHRLSNPVSCTYPVPLGLPNGHLSSIYSVKASLASLSSLILITWPTHFNLPIPIFLVSYIS